MRLTLRARGVAVSVAFIFALGFAFLAALVAAEVWLYGHTHEAVSLIPRRPVPKALPPVQAITVRAITAGTQEARP